MPLGRLAEADRPEPDQHVRLHQADRRRDGGRGAGGRVINIASISGLIANRGIGGRHYETAKAAVVGFTRATAADWAPHGVTVNAIAPGGFMTDANRRWKTRQPGASIETFQAQIPMGGSASPRTWARWRSTWPATRRAYMTGAVLVIDGGYTLW